MLNLNPDHVVLKRGLNLKETHKELMRGKRMGDVGERTLAHYLADMQRTGLHNHATCKSAAVYGCKCVGLEARRARRLVQAGQARCSGEAPCNDDRGIEEDRTTPAGMRRRVLARDGYCCVSCGDRDDLQVHHIVFLRDGGPTVDWNLTVVCAACHGLVHAGLLVIRGRAPDELQLLKADGEPVVPPVVTGEPAYSFAPSDEVAVDDPLPKDTKPMFLSYDEIPDVVSREWWTKHARLLDWVPGPGLRMKIKPAAFR